MTEKYSSYSSNIYPCPKNSCSFVGSLNAFGNGECYRPCPKCGAEKFPRTGRFVYKKKKLLSWLPFIFVYRYDRVEYTKQ